MSRPLFWISKKIFFQLLTKGSKYDIIYRHNTKIWDCFPKSHKIRRLISLSMLTLAAYKRAWLVFVEYTKRILKNVFFRAQISPKHTHLTQYLTKDLILNNSTILHCDRNISALPKIPTLAAYKRAWHGFVGYAKRIRENEFHEPLRNKTAYHNATACIMICRNIEAVTTRRSWKFAVASFCKVPKSLDTLDVFALRAKQKIIPSKTFSKKFANLKT